MSYIFRYYLSMKFIGISLIGLLFSVITLKYLSIPYILISTFWLLLCIIFLLFSRNTIAKNILFNLSVLIIALGASEVYAYITFSNNPIIQGSYTQDYFTSNDILGYGPVKGKRVNAKKVYDKKIIYDVTYTIDKSGLRISPLFRSRFEHECILFFGGSYTFGEGVNDHEAMPYVVGKLSNFKVFNFGFHGYGPHQMLSAIEHGMVKRIINCQPKFAIYQAILPAHIARSAGDTSWDNHGPKYILKNKKLQYIGHFDDTHSIIEYFKNKLTNQLKKSYFYNKYN